MKPINIIRSRGLNQQLGWIAAGGMAVVMVLPMMSRSQEAAAPEAAPKKSTWERSAGLGLTLTDGNSDTLLFTANVDAIKKWQKNELSLGATATYGEDDGEKNNELARGIAQYNRLFTERLFGYARIDLLHDAIADVEYRLTMSPGVGYYFFKRENFFLAGEFGPGYVVEKQGGENNDYVIVRLAERLEYKLNDRARVWQLAEFLPQVDDSDNWIMNAEVGLETAVTKTLSLRVLLQDTYDNEPAPDRTENDVKLITALNVKF